MFCSVEEPSSMCVLSVLMAVFLVWGVWFLVLLEGAKLCKYSLIMTWTALPICRLNKTSSFFLLILSSLCAFKRLPPGLLQVSVGVTALPNFKWSSRHNLHTRRAQLYSNSTSKRSGREKGDFITREELWTASPFIDNHLWGSSGRVRGGGGERGQERSKNCLKHDEMFVSSFKRCSSNFLNTGCFLC